MSEALGTAYFTFSAKTFFYCKERSHYKCSLHWAPAGCVATSRVYDQCPYIWLMVTQARVCRPMVAVHSLVTFKWDSTLRGQHLSQESLWRKVAQSNSNSPSLNLTGFHAVASSPRRQRSSAPTATPGGLLKLQEVKNYIPLTWLMCAKGGV